MHAQQHGHTGKANQASIQSFSRSRQTLLPYYCPISHLRVCASPTAAYQPTIVSAPILHQCTRSSMDIQEKQTKPRFSRFREADRRFSPITVLSLICVFVPLRLLRINQPSLALQSFTNARAAAWTYRKSKPSLDSVVFAKPTDASPLLLSYLSSACLCLSDCCVSTNHR